MASAGLLPERPAGGAGNLADLFEADGKDGFCKRLHTACGKLVPIKAAIPFLDSAIKYSYFTAVAEEPIIGT